MRSSRTPLDLLNLNLNYEKTFVPEKLVFAFFFGLGLETSLNEQRLKPDILWKCGLGEIAASHFLPLVHAT